MDWIAVEGGKAMVKWLKKIFNVCINPASVGGIEGIRSSFMGECSMKG